MCVHHSSVIAKEFASKISLRACPRKAGAQYGHRGAVRLTKMAPPWLSLTRFLFGIAAVACKIDIFVDAGRALLRSHVAVGYTLRQESDDERPRLPYPALLA